MARGALQRVQRPVPGRRLGRRRSGWSRPGGARAAAPVAKDALTFLFDRQKAMESLAALEQQWGGTLAERTARRAEIIKAIAAQSA